MADSAKGDFDKSHAEVLSQRVYGFRTLKNLDIVSNTLETLVNYVDFVSGVADCVFLIDSSSCLCLRL